MVRTCIQNLNILVVIGISGKHRNTNGLHIILITTVSGIIYVVIRYIEIIGF